MARRLPGRCPGLSYVALSGLRNSVKQRRMVVLAVGVDDVGDELRAILDEAATPAEQITRRSLLPRIDVGDWKHAAAQETGDLGRVDAVVLGLATVDRL